MSGSTAVHGEYRVALRNNRLGLWLFFLSESFLFMGILVTRFYLWGNTRPELNQLNGLLVTIVLLLSSFTMNRAETALVQNDRNTAEGTESIAIFDDSSRERWANSWQ